MTSTGTFQKYFEPEELKQWVEAVLDEKAVTAAPEFSMSFETLPQPSNFSRNSRASAQPNKGSPTCCTHCGPSCSNLLKISLSRTAACPSQPRSSALAK